MPSKRIVIIGAGHNGLITGIFLARAGYQVQIFETLEKTGGAATTDRAPCGCKLSSGASVLGAMPKFLQDELGLSLTMFAPDPQMSVMLNDGRIVDFFADPQQTGQSIFGIFGEQGLNDYRRFSEDYSRAADVYAPFHHAPGEEQDLAKKLGHLADVFLNGSFQTIKDAYFKDDALAAAVCATTQLYPARSDEPGTAFPLLYLSQNAGGYAHVKGGMGEIAKALEDKATQAGVAIICNAPVKHILHRDQKAYGVRLANGAEHQADFIFSNLSPAATQALCHGQKQPNAVDPGIYDCGALKLNLVLNGMPSALAKAVRGTRQRFLLCLNAGFDELDEAWRHFRLGQIPDKPYLELTLPSALDPSLCCSPHHHPMSIYGLYFPYFVHEKQNQREMMKDTVIQSLEKYFPGFKDQIVHCEILSSYMIEQRWGMTHGNVDHGSIVPDNRLNKRVRALSIEGLAICGAGGHPGGLVSGLPGYLAAKSFTGTTRRG